MAKAQLIFKKKKKEQRLLFIYPGGLGDVILLIPTLELINHYQPKLSVDLILEKRAFQPIKELFREAQNLTFIKQIKCFDFKSENKVLALFKLIAKVQNYQVVISSGSSIFVSVVLFFSRATKTIGFKSKLSKFLISHSVSLKKNQYFAESLLELAKPLRNPKIEYKSRKNNLPSLVFKKKTFEEIAEKQKFTNLSQYCLIHPGVSRLSLQKNIIKSPNQSYWISLIKKLIFELNEKVILVGGKNEKKLILKIKQSLSASESSGNFFIFQNLKAMDLAYLIKKSKSLICTDSGPMHISLALNHKTFVVWGATDQKNLVPEELIREKICIISKVRNLLCSPCLWSTRSSSCSLKACITQQRPEELLEIYKINSA